MKISAVVSVYSETELLVATVKEIHEVLRGRDHEILLVVHPKSSAECLSICERLSVERGVRIIMQGPRSGIGWAYREAIPYISGTHALIMSSDLETNPGDARAMVETAEQSGADLVCASRWMRGGGFQGYNPLKFLLNFIYNFIFRALYRTAIHDITFGYKLVRTDVLQSVKWEYGTHEFCAELLLKPLRLGYTAAEVPTRWVKRQAGESKMTFARNFRFVSAAWKILRQKPEQMVQESAPGLQPANAVPGVPAATAVIKPDIVTSAG